LTVPAVAAGFTDHAAYGSAGWDTSKVLASFLGDETGKDYWGSWFYAPPPDWFQADEVEVEKVELCLPARLPGGPDGFPIRLWYSLTQSMGDGPIQNTGSPFRYAAPRARAGWLDVTDSTIPSGSGAAAGVWRCSPGRRATRSPSPWRGCPARSGSHGLNRNERESMGTTARGAYFPNGSDAAQPVSAFQQLAESISDPPNYETVAARDAADLERLSFAAVGDIAYAGGGTDWQVMFKPLPTPRQRSTASGDTSKTWVNVNWSGAASGDHADSLIAYQSGLFTIPTEGQYLVSARICFAASAAATGWLGIRARANGSQILASAFTAAPVPGFIYGTQVTWCGRLAAGATLAVQAYNSTDGNWALHPTAEANNISVACVGP
jgi:hypothetical protein